MKQKPTIPPEKVSTPKERFERFVSALIRVPKQEIDEQQRKVDDKKPQKDLQSGL